MEDMPSRLRSLSTVLMVQSGSREGRSSSTIMATTMPMTVFCRAFRISASRLTTLSSMFFSWVTLIRNTNLHSRMKMTMPQMPSGTMPRIYFSGSMIWPPDMAVN